MTYKKRTEMANGNTSWIDSRTLRNMDLIMDCLEANKGKKFTYKKLAEKTGMNVKQVQFACQKLAFKKEPLIQIFAERYGYGGQVKVAEKVKLKPATGGKN